MRRGSTPLITISSDAIEFDNPVTFTDYDNLVFTLKQGTTVINIDSSDMTLEDNVYTFYLSQEDTLALASSKEKVLIQVKLKSDNNVQVSDLSSFSMEKVLNEEVI